MKELINFFIGQAGVQISSAIWELFCADHGIELNGECREDFSSDDGIDRFFFINKKNKALPRCLTIDLESTVIDEIRCGPYKELFGMSNLISGMEDSASIFSRGYFSLGRIQLNNILERFNTLAENCDSLQGFTFFHALGGGTGSGLHALVVEELSNYYKTTKVDIGIYPSYPNSPLIVEPYNSILSNHYSIDEIDVSLIHDNEALFRLTNRNLRKSNSTYCDLNRVVAKAFDIFTSSLRFGGLSLTINELMHNLIPYPRIHFPTASLAPLGTNDDIHHSISTVFNLTKEGLSNTFQLANCDPTEGKYMSCCFMYRGDVESGEVYDAIRKLKLSENLRFVDWCPTGIKVSLCSRPPIVIARSGIGCSDRVISIISNNSSIVDPILHNIFRFQVLFQKRAFVHWFVGEGMEEDEFRDAMENIACLVKDYEECALSSTILGEEYFENNFIHSDKTTEITKTDFTNNDGIQNNELGEIQDENAIQNGHNNEGNNDICYNQFEQNDSHNKSNVEFTNTITIPIKHKPIKNTNL